MRRVVFSAAAPGWCRAALLCCGIGAGMSLSDLAHAAPPQQLVGKSVVVTWNESRIQRTVGQAEFRSVQASHVMSLYVGESGRVFSRLTNTTRAGSGSSEQVEGQSGNSQLFRARVPSFSGHSMTFFQPFQQGGMRRMVVDFDAGFASCAAKVAFAKESGAETSLTWSPIIHKMVEFKSATASGESCTVKSGNVFANDQ